MLRSDSMLSYHLARQHQNDLLAEADRERLIRAARSARRAAASQPMVGRQRSSTLWQRLALVFGRTSTAPNLASSPNLAASGQ